MEEEVGVEIEKEEEEEEEESINILCWDSEFLSVGEEEEDDFERIETGVNDDGVKEGESEEA